MDNKNYRLKNILKLILIAIAFYYVIFTEKVIPDGPLLDGVIISRTIFIVFILHELSKLFDNIGE